MKMLFTLIFVLNWSLLAKESDSHQKAELGITEKPQMSHQGHGEHKGHKGHKHKEGHKMKAGLEKMTPSQAVVKVQGMVCAFCAQGIEKNFKKKNEVSAVEVDLDKMQVLIKFKKGQSLTEASIKEVVTGAGFQYKGLKDAQ